MTSTVAHVTLAPLDSARAEATTRRTYNRPKDAEGTKFEDWGQTIHRAHYEHHNTLWAAAQGKPLTDGQKAELEELKGLGLSRAGLVSGRTLWLGGTEYAYSRAASQFNCSALELATIFDMVDAFWLLLNGSGVGGKPRVGTLHGYNRPIPTLRIVPSDRDPLYRGHTENHEDKPTEANKYTWTVTVGDSAEAWAKVLGKMICSPRGRCDVLIVDFSNVRGKGGRLRGYGWICNGYEPLAQALEAVHNLLNGAAGNLLDEEEIGDIFNWCGTVLSSRRAAEALLLDDFNPRAMEFATRKSGYFLCNRCGHWDTPNNTCTKCGGPARNPQRRQSNNSLMFWHRPSRSELADLLRMNLEGGEPGFVNALAALRKCPWFRVFNPCYEILLPNAGFCNLVSLSLPHFGRNFRSMERATWVMARANYRQTCVNLEDGMLQPRWHQTNEALRLCGVSFTGVAQAGWLTDYQIRRLRNAAVTGAYGMADELGLPRPKAITTIKPEGTRSKISPSPLMGETMEGIHQALGRHIFNWVNFSVNDPLVGAMEAAGYKTMISPADPNNVLVRFPIEYRGGTFVKDHRGAEVNRESALSQLRRYRRWNTLWADHNVSATIMLDEPEIPDVADWIYRHWEDGYVATAFMRRTDPSLTAAEQGHPYLPQEVVTADQYAQAMEDLRPVDWDRFHRGIFDVDGTDCAGGVCPVK